MLDVKGMGMGIGSLMLYFEGVAVSAHPPVSVFLSCRVQTLTRTGLPEQRHTRSHVGVLGANDCSS